MAVNPPVPDYMHPPMPGYTNNPGYVDLVRDTYRTIKWHYRDEAWGNYTFPASFFHDFNYFFSFPIKDTYPIFYIAIIFTIIRYTFNNLLSNPLVSWLKVDRKSDRTKFNESFWKCVTYSLLWGYVADLLIFSGKYNFFTSPENIWDDWALDMAIPFDITLIYFIECGFYVHSIYATIWMDEKRKDFAVMLIHHVLTLTLIVVSYATKYHKIGLMVLFVHDATDILLEFTKCNVYLKNRNGKFYAYHEHISNICFAAFTLAWYVFRLYWFPLKVLYSTAVISVHRAYYRGAGLYLFFNSLLWILLCLDIYWFYFVLNFLYKVLTGQLKSVEDVRDLDEEEEEEKKDSKKKDK